MRAALSALDKVSDPLERLDAARRVVELSARVEENAVAEARAAGHTWAEIGARFGLTKQGAQQRFQRDVPDVARRRRAKDAK